MKKRLFTHVYTYFLVSILLVVLLLSSVFFFSIRRSVAIWNVNRGQRLENLLLPLLTQIYQMNGELQESEINRALSPFLTSNVFAYVFDTRQNPVYIYSQGGRVPLYDEKMISTSLERLNDRSRPLTAIIGNGEIIGYLAADTLGFTHDIANKRFLQSVFTFVFWGAGMAVLVAGVAAYIFSKIISRQALSLVTGLQKLTDGERQIRFPDLKILEMSEIADSVSQLQKKLEYEESLRRQWAEDVAHDLRTPVSALKVQLEGITDGVFDTNHERMSALFEEVTKIDSLVQDLRELNKVESPEMRITREEITVSPFLKQVLSSFLSLDHIQDDNFFIKCDISSCRADRHYLHRALTNVLQNALRYGKPGGVIRLDVYKRKDYTVFDISNEGLVEEEKTELYFNRLYRGNASRSNPGSGLGLPITRAIMRLHGGDAAMKQINKRTHLLLTLHDPL